MNPRRVLIVDDDPALLSALPETVRLRLDGVEIDTCDSASEALDRIAATDYDAIVSDIKMPGMDGLGLLAEIKQRRPETPTLLITGHGERDLAVAALRGGAHDLVQKPIDRDYFLASLERAIHLRALNRQVAEHKRALERHARVLEHVGDGVFLVDDDGFVQFWNPAAEAITNLGSEAVLGKRIDSIIPTWSSVAPSVPVAERPGAANRPPNALPVELNGRELWLSVAGVRFDEGTVYAFRDMTAERAVDDLKRDFVATASHELRTPLAAIYGAAITLRRNDLELDPAGRSGLLGIIAQECDRLTHIVNEILLADHLDSGRLRFLPAPVDPLQAVTKVVEAARVYAPESVAIEVEAGDELPALSADPEHLRQILANLVDNAVKYSPDGGRISVHVESRNGFVRFAVGDEGLGIPTGEQDRIFDKFYRLDPNLTRGVRGTGLGLYICRELVRRMEGHIAVESTPGKGSRFVVDLPVLPGSNAGTRDGMSTEAGAGTFPQPL
jgi:two-component system phosphate regulon sensor histidine kinase PhoR